MFNFDMVSNQYYAHYGEGNNDADFTLWGFVFLDRMLNFLV